MIFRTTFQSKTVKKFRNLSTDSSVFTEISFSPPSFTTTSGPALSAYARESGAAVSGAWPSEGVGALPAVAGQWGQSREHGTQLYWPAAAALYWYFPHPYSWPLLFTSPSPDQSLLDQSR